MSLYHIKLIIFDLDGTLVNSQFDITDGINQTLMSFKRKPLSVNAVQSLIGGGVEKLVKSAFSDVSDQVMLDEALKIFNKYYHNNLTTKTGPYKGVLEVLKHFSILKKAVYSNKPHDLTVQIINQLNLNSFFSHVQGSNNIKYKPKPSSEGIEFILEKLKVKPEHTIIVGDSTHDIHAGQKAGIQTCAVTYGYRTENVLAKENPDFIIHKLPELIKLINVH